MKKTFQSEDTRKDKLFDAWNGYLSEVIDPKFNLLVKDPTQFDRTYEGLVTITRMTPIYMNLKLETGEKINQVPISEEIMESSDLEDTMYMVLGKKENKWWPLDLISIGSIFAKDRVHLSFNPLIVGPQPNTKGTENVQ